jgi:O-acetyl-ADP-ribose deacetylase (regulator of RNase III)
MIEHQKGNLLKAEAEALVNTVNCVGAMGKGIALQFKQAYPENFKEYERACKAKKVKPGEMFIVSTGSEINPKYIINFPTKRHWRGQSKIEDICNGLKALIDNVKHLEIKSVAVPPLGCGNGGLKWSEVKPMIEEAFSSLPDVHVLLYLPQEGPNATDMPVATTKPNVTRGRALLIKLMELYRIPGYSLSLLEIQKLAYFLQLAGEPLRLKYSKHKYGPYTETLNHALQNMEGHYIRGYGDRNTRADIALLPEAVEAANDFLSKDPEAEVRLERVHRLIEGFETPYGLELLATVHWVMSEDLMAAIDQHEAIDRTHKWNARKRDLFKPEHIIQAWKKLREENWVTSNQAAA